VRMATMDDRWVEALVRRYYDLIDAKDLDAVIAIFDCDAVYRRPGYPDLVGKGAIETFYRQSRRIEDGRHTLTGVVVKGRQAATEGTFRGSMRDGEEVSVGFAEFWSFTAANLAVKRTTYFFTASV
jgi:steroid Delta-isomerase